MNREDNNAMNRFALIILFTAAVVSATAADAPRERISINDNWRFTKSDPNGDSTGLIYDVRPEVKDKKDDKDPAPSLMSCASFKSFWSMATEGKRAPRSSL